MKRARHATIYDIAAEAGVSIATVSRVLRGEPSVAPAKRERVENAIRLHNYRPSSAARKLAGTVTKTVGIVLPRLFNPYYAMLFTGAQEKAREMGYALSLFPWSSLDMESFDPALLLAERCLEGAVVYLEYLPPADKDRILHFLKRLKEFMNVAVIGCDLSEYGFPGIFINNAALALKIVRYLVSLGHERIALIGGSEEDTDPFRRDAGYLEGLREAQLPFTESYRVWGGDTPESGLLGLNGILDGLKPSFWPTAVIALNDLVALGCFSAAAAHGLSLPGDLSVIGCDNLVSAPYLAPPLTSVDLHQRRIGARAVEMVISGESGIEEAEWDIVVRGSCAPCPSRG
ncbi:MAG: LacI family DNA-binding transcriptional regulator [Clostridia bacterium]|nr:LacI family DNA-binding transcriptional regulator [Clostridia bacterium]